MYNREKHLQSPKTGVRFKTLLSLLLTPADPSMHSFGECHFELLNFLCASHGKTCTGLHVYAGPGQEGMFILSCLTFAEGHKFLLTRGNSLAESHQPAPLRSDGNHSLSPCSLKIL